MSLIAWWPLTGHTNNYGSMGGELQATGSSVTYTDGKIGQAMYTGSLNLTADQWQKMIGNTISIAMWVYTREDGTYSAGTPFFGNGGMTKPNNRKFTIFHYSNRTTLHCSWQHDDQSGTDAKSTYWGCSYANFFELNRWVHLCIVQDAATETITVYKNGEEYSRTKVDGLASFNIKSAAAAPIRNSIDYQNTNDIRIYDHALSAFEVKEIAKALVVHYTFDDMELAPVNLITSFGTLSRCTKQGNGLKIDWSSNSGDTYFMMNLLDPLVKGETYTISFDCEGTIGDAVEFRVCNLKNYPIVLKSGKNSLTFVVGDDILADGRFFLDDATRDSSVFTITNIQLERNDHATPYTEWNKTPALAGTVGNDAGYIKGEAENLAFGPGRAGERSGRFNGTTSYVDIPIIKSDMFTSDYTISFWVYPLDNGRAIYLGDYNGSTGLNFERVSGDNGDFRYYHGGSPNWYYSAAGAPVGQWTHLAITYSVPPSNGTTGELLIYKNGVCVNSNNDNTQKSHTSTMTKTVGGKTRLGADYRSTSTTDSTPLQGYMDDFRYYATCLKKEDIEDLYRTKAYITDKSDIVCNKFIENCETALVTETSVFEAMEIYENLLSEEYEQLEYIEFDYVQGSSEPYINTGYNTTGIYQIDCDIEVRAAASNYQFGQQQKSGWMYNGFYSTGSLEFNWAALTPRPTPAARHIMTQTLSDDETQIVITIDGVTWTTSPGTNGQGGDFYIFACRNNNNAFRHYGAGMTLYSFRIHEGYRTVRDFIPARRRSDGVIGLYDTATQMLYTNAGTGEFKAGPVVTNNEAMIYENGNISGKEIIEI